MMVQLTIFGTTTPVWFSSNVVQSVSPVSAADPLAGAWVTELGAATRVAESAAVAAAAFGLQPPPNPVVTTSTFIPVFDFLGGPSTVTIGSPWVWQTVYDQSTGQQTCTLVGRLHLDCNTSGAIPMRFTLPLTPSPLFPYPESLAGTWTPDDALAQIQGWGTQPSAVISAVPGGAEASLTAWTPDGKPQEVVVSLTYRSL